jgi:hypothetical protein
LEWTKKTNPKPKGDFTMRQDIEKQIMIDPSPSERMKQFDRVCALIVCLGIAIALIVTLGAPLCGLAADLLALTRQ